MRVERGDNGIFKGSPGIIPAYAGRTLKRSRYTANLVFDYKKFHLVYFSSMFTSLFSLPINSCIIFTSSKALCGTTIFISYSFNTVSNL